MVFVCWVGWAAFAAYASGQKLTEKNMYEYIPPAPLITNVNSEKDYIRFCNEHRQRAVMECYVVIARMKEKLEKERDQDKADNILDDMGELEHKILVLNSPLVPYTPLLHNKQLAKHYDHDHKEKYTTAWNAHDWSIADGKNTKVKGVIGYITTNKVTLIRMDDSTRTVSIRMLKFADRVMAYAALLAIEKQVEAMRLEMLLRKPDVAYSGSVFK